MAKSESFRDKSSPYQFYMPERLKKRGLKKAQAHGVHISKFMQMAWEQFVDRPIEDSIRRLTDHNKKMKQKEKKNTHVTRQSCE